MYGDCVIKQLGMRLQAALHTAGSTSWSQQLPKGKHQSLLDELAITVGP